MFEFNYEKSIKFKKKFKDDEIANVIWRNRFAPSNVIGNCSNLYRKLQPKNYEDFYNKYIQYSEEHNFEEIYKRGLTHDELITLSNEYKSLHYDETNKDYDVEEYFHEAISHIIIETYDGQKQERIFRAYLENKGYKCGVIDGKLDAKYGIDIKIEDKKVYAIQIKPYSFFIAKRKDTVEDQRKLCHKYESLLSNYGIKTYYAIYRRYRDGTVRWLKNKNGFRFKIGELFDYDKDDINNTMVAKDLSCYSLQSLT